MCIGYKEQRAGRPQKGNVMFTDSYKDLAAAIFADAIAEMKECKAAIASGRAKKSTMKNLAECAAYIRIHADEYGLDWREILA